MTPMVAVILYGVICLLAGWIAGYVTGRASKNKENNIKGDRNARSK